MITQSVSCRFPSASKAELSQPAVRSAQTKAGRGRSVCRWCWSKEWGQGFPAMVLAVGRQLIWAKKQLWLLVFVGHGGGEGQECKLKYLNYIIWPEFWYTVMSHETVSTSNTSSMPKVSGVHGHPSLLRHSAPDNHSPTFCHGNDFALPSFIHVESVV